MNEEPKQNADGVGAIQKLTRLLAAPVIEPSQRAARIQAVEKDIVLPLRLLIITIVGYYLFFANWLVIPSTNTTANAVLSHSIMLKHEREKAETSSLTTNLLATNLSSPVEPEFFDSWLNITTNLLATNLSSPHVAKPKRPGGSPDTDPVKLDWSLQHATELKACFIAYVVLNLWVGAILIWGRQLTLTKMEWMVFAAGALDCLLMGILTFLNSGFDSLLYPVFAALILHNAVAIPVAFPQLLLNCLTIVSFATAGILDQRIIIRPVIMDVENISLVKPYERIIVLVAWALCCYGIQMLFEKQKRAEAEATELAVRQERLHTAGRLAAEIAHQIKNPLGIITNAAFCLKRAVQDGEVAVEDQIQIIREEVDRAAQIITELMGYAQLAEGIVERLDVAEELEAALQEVYPPAAKYQVNIRKNFAPDLPALLMQKRHLSSVLVNILQNAREAMHGQGDVQVLASYGENDSIRITIDDTGPGIPPDKIDKIFDAYFTTREKGTGLGLAIVKHNTEMYGGVVKVESELGKGTRFVLEFPARIIMRLSK